jgi:hypothetical protein
VSSLVENVMAIAILTPDGHVRQAGFTTSEGARWQRGLLSVYAHCAILGGFDKPYVLPADSPDEDHTSDAQDAQDGDSSDGEGDEVDGEPAVREDDVAEMEEQCMSLAFEGIDLTNQACAKNAPVGFVSFPETGPDLLPIAIPDDGGALEDTDATDDAVLRWVLGL